MKEAAARNAAKAKSVNLKKEKIQKLQVPIGTLPEAVRTQTPTGRS